MAYDLIAAVRASSCWHPNATFPNHASCIIKISPSFLLKACLILTPFLYDALPCTSFMATVSATTSDTFPSSKEHPQCHIVWVNASRNAPLVPGDNSPFILAFSGKGEAPFLIHECTLINNNYFLSAAFNIKQSKTTPTIAITSPCPSHVRSI